MSYEVVSDFDINMKQAGSTVFDGYRLLYRWASRDEKYSIILRDVDDDVVKVMWFEDLHVAAEFYEHVFEHEDNKRYEYADLVDRYGYVIDDKENEGYVS